MTKKEQAAESQRRREIAGWMRLHMDEHRDGCGHVNLTALVEDWDRECSTGGATLDSNHPAWEIAVEVAA